MQSDHGLGSSLGNDLLAPCLKALTSDHFLAELVAPPLACGPICMNQAARTTMLAAMPMLDNVDIIVVHRGDLFRGMAILRADVSGGLGGAIGDYGGTIIRGGPAGGGPTDGRDGGPACGWAAMSQAIPALPRPPTRAIKSRCRSSSTTMKYPPTRTSPCIGSCGHHPLSAGRAVPPPA
jgi:hypothetical protein